MSSPSLEIQIEIVLTEKAEAWIIEMYISFSKKEIENENRQNLMPHPICIQQPIVETSGPSEIDTAHDAIADNLKEKVNELVKQVAALEGTVKAWSQSKFLQGRSGHTKSKTLEKICWYHRRWGSKALKCVLPCGWIKDEPEKD
ncbi:hypothetical protein B5X24_HaOG213356 [Helicoverpa armigera]|uniref:Uncharacterized protein n=1 Tax=Helicoverpa armigera TaxID=29058 RepID=A0A2W1BCC3_HELAM|nr:hypothetical protein B5X24_HaOG213356 [Helicoverpa armigera]